jgi:hypothetical protein
MSSIIQNGDTFNGISVERRGVFTDEYGRTYAGQIRDGHACGLGVLTWPNGHKEYAEHGPDGKFDGRWLSRDANGDAFHSLFERGKQKDFAGDMWANGSCVYNLEDCAPDDPRVLALIAQVAPVEVRPAASAKNPPIAAHSPSNRPMARPARFAPAGAGGRRGHRGAHPFRTPSLVAVRHSPNSSHTAKHVHPVTRARAFLRYWSRGKHPLAPANNRHLVHTNGPVPAALLPWHRPARRRTERCHSRQRCTSACTCRTPRAPPPLPPSH